MGKTLVSHRLDDELLAWATGYAKVRGSSRAVVIEEGLRHFRGLSAGGVPDLPEPEGAAKWAATGAPVPSLLGGRQSALNEAKLRASGSRR